MYKFISLSHIELCTTCLSVLQTVLQEQQIVLDSESLFSLISPL